MTIEANVIRVMVKIKLEPRRSVLLKKIVTNLNEGPNKNYSSRYIGGIIRNTLGLETKHTREGSRVVWDKLKIKKLIVDYNLKDEFMPYIKQYKKILKKLKKNKNS